MPKRSDKIEYEKRIRSVMEYIIDDHPACDILRMIMPAWDISHRTAERYIAEARGRWRKEGIEDPRIEHRRKMKIHSLNKLKRSLKTEYKGTPEGIRAILAVEKEIIDIMGIRPARKQEIEEPPPADEIDYDALSAEALQQILGARKKINGPVQDIEYTEVHEGSEN